MIPFSQKLHLSTVISTLLVSWVACDSGLEESVDIPVPQRLQVEVLSQKELALSWVNADSNEVGFIVERKRDNSNYGNLASVSGTFSFLDTVRYIDASVDSFDLRYSYRVRAIQGRHQSRHSNEVSVAWTLADEKVRSLDGHTGDVSVVALSHDGSLLASGSEDKTIKLWDTATGAAIRTLRSQANAEPGRLNFSLDGRLLSSGGAGASNLSRQDIPVSIWNVATGNEMHVLSYEASRGLGSVTFSPDNSLLAVSGNRTDNMIKIWNAETGTLYRTIPGGFGFALSLAFSPDGSLLASGNRATNNNDNIRVWDVSSGDEAFSLRGNTDDIAFMAFSTDGSLLASGGGLFGRVVLWQIPSGTQIFSERYPDLSFIAFNEDGSMLTVATASNLFGRLSGRARILDIASDNVILALAATSAEIHAVVFTPKGFVIAAGRAGPTVKLWTAGTWHSVPNQQ